MPDLVLPRPLAHQREVLAHPARYKVLRWGRRRGKTRTGFLASTVGHGPDRCYRGILQGAHGVWIAPDFPQSRAIWREEIKPRFAPLVNAGLAELNESERRVSLTGAGSLEIRSAEVIDSLRGRRLDFVIGDEAAYWDLEYGYREVIRAALLDAAGWLLLFSTPNAGKDGNPDKVTPSYFNRLCELIHAGELGDDWVEFYGPTRGSPHLDPAEVEAMYAEYPAASPVVAQELDAKLIVGGAGLAFPEFSETHHTYTHATLPAGWRWVGGLDWGYSSPGSFSLHAFGPDKQHRIHWEHYFRQRTPHDVGLTVGLALKHRRDLVIPEWIAADSAMFNSDDGENHAEHFQAGLVEALAQFAPMVVPAPKGPGSRVAGKLLVHEGLKYDPVNVRPDGTLAPFHQPRTKIHATNCPDLIRTVPRLPVDERNPEDVDTDAEDHGYDGWRYVLLARAPQTKRDESEGYSQHKSPGFDKPPGGAWTRRRPDLVNPDTPRPEQQPQGVGVSYRWQGGSEGQSV
jgi:hypothetical protein